MTHSHALLLTLLALGGCSTADGTHPNDMSVAAHEAAAKSNDATASQHAASYDSNAETSHTHCSPGGRNSPGLNEPCWSSTSNPTADHQREAGAFRSTADAHRKAAKTLRDAEATACTGIAEDDRDISPFAHREDIASANDLNVSRGGAHGDSRVLSGATIVLRGVPGLTKEYLEHVIACHLARNAAAGFDMPEMGFCPLGVKGASATVTSVDGGFSVDIKADDDAAAQEIVKRARLLVSRPEYTPAMHK